jgi:hypothetical protein
LPDSKARVCGSTRANKGIPPDLEQEAKHFKKEQSVFWNSDETVQVWKDKRIMRRICMICDATILNTGTKETQTWKKRNVMLLSSKINA